MTAAAQWYEEALEDEEEAAAPRLLQVAITPEDAPRRPALGAPDHGAPDHGAPDHGAPDHGAPSAGRRWNVLAEQLVEFPRPAQKLFLGERGSLVEPSDVPAPRSYGEMWLDQELARLRRASAGAPSPARADTLACSAAPTPAVALVSGRRVRAVSPDFAAWVASVDRDLQNFSTDPIFPASRARDARVAPPSRRGAARLLSTESKPSRAARPITHVGSAAARPATRGLRRILPSAAALAILGAVLWGASAVASSGHGGLQALPGSVKTSAGYVYVARPGDTLWSIASRIDPAGNPQPIVANLESQIHGSVLVPGDKLLLP